MATWLQILLTGLVLVILVGGILNFPYVPMWFGIYGAERNSTQGKFVYRLIWLFPFVAVTFLVLTWMSSGVFILFPFAYIGLLWAIRPNKNSAEGPCMQYKSRAENLHAKMSEIDYRWVEWCKYATNNNYLLLTFFSPSPESTASLRDTLTKSENLYSEIETSSYANNTANLYLRLKITSIDKEEITRLLEDLVSNAWNCECELSSIDVMQIDE